MKPRKVTWGWLLALCLAGLLGSPAGAQVLPEAPGGWLRFGALPPVIGVDGKLHEATCSGFPDTDPQFSFWARRGTVNKLVVFFDGGGACWDNLTCSLPATGDDSDLPALFTPSIGPSDDPSGYDGIARLDSAANPVKDWNMVFIPYCTGDVHLGSTTRQYSNVANPELPWKATFEIEHRGFDNFMVVLDWIRHNFPAPEKILVTGSSAGGYGAAGNFPWIAWTYPAAQIYVVTDASQGATPLSFDGANPGRGSWNPSLPPWIFGTEVTNVRSADILLRAAQYYPNVRVGQFTTNYDSVQISFYALMELINGAGGSCRNPVLDWNRQMLSSLGTYARSADNYRYFLARGRHHTIMGAEEFYSEGSDGIAFADWLASMLEEGNANGPVWRNTSCRGCLIPAPCL